MYPVEMKEFDWSVCEKLRSHNVYSWLKANHSKPVNLTDYILVMRALAKANRLAGAKKHLNSKKFHRKISGHHLKREYAILRERFGFFPGV